MSLSPFDSFQSRFVSYLMNFPRKNRKQHQGQKVPYIVSSIFALSAFTPALHFSPLCFSYKPFA